MRNICLNGLNECYPTWFLFRFIIFLYDNVAKKISPLRGWEWWQIFYNNFIPSGLKEWQKNLRKIKNN